LQPEYDYQPYCFLLISGIIAEPVTHPLNPDDLFGDLLFPFFSLAITVILFEGTHLAEKQ
jgi:CPA1 family monovalent cation:H+ antiporter